MSLEKEITIYDIAAHLNISATTVSRGLRDNPVINKHTRKKIQDAAKKLGYQSNTFASSLRSKKTHSIGVIVPRLNSYFVASVLAGMEDEATRAGYNLIITHSLESAEKEKANAETLFNKRVDGLLVALANNTENIDHLQSFISKNIPVVFFDRVYIQTDCTTIVIDNKQAAYNVTKHLIDKGCRRIMHLGGSQSLNVYYDRMLGYKQALQEAGLRFDKKLLVISKLTESAGTEVAEQILRMKSSERPDAVFTANDTTAVHCMIRLKAAGIRIPADIAFAGFNNDPISRVVEPNLTTVNYPGYAMGQAAVNSLMENFNGDKKLLNTQSIILRSELVIRESSLKENGF